MCKICFKDNHFIKKIKSDYRSDLQIHKTNKLIKKKEYWIYIFRNIFSKAKWDIQANQKKGYKYDKNRNSKR